MPYKIDRFNFSDQTIDNFNKVGITPDQVKSWIDDGRANGVKDERIVDFIKDQYNELNAPNTVGRDLSGGLRYVASKVPFVGDWVDEIEAAVKAGKISGPEYEQYLKNAQESIAGAERGFKETSANGNWVDRNVLRYAPEAMRFLGDAWLAAATGGKTLMPRVSALQSAIEGYGSGSGTDNRLVNAGIHGAVGYAIPAVLNKIWPTKNVAEETIKVAAKGPIAGAKRPITNVVAKALKTGKEPVEVIAKESTRGTEPAIMKGMQQALKSNNAQAKVIYDSAVRNVDYKGGFVKYVKDRMPEGLSETVKNRLSRGFAALENTFEEAGAAEGELLVKENLPAMVDSVINMAMRGASEAERSAVKQAAIKAFSERHVAKEVTKKLIPQNMVGNIGNQISTIRPDRIVTRPVGNLLNTGTLNTMRGGVSASSPYVQKIIQALQPSDMVRGATDSVIEQQILR